MALRTCGPAAAALLTTLTAMAQSNAVCRDLRLTNGKIVTMDKRNSVVTSVVIQNGRFAGADAKLSPCAKTVNLRGRAAVPGLIDNHNHIVLLGLRPGHDVRLALSVPAELKPSATTG